MVAIHDGPAAAVMQMLQQRAATTPASTAFVLKEGELADGKRLEVTYQEMWAMVTRTAVALLEAQTRANLQLANSSNVMCMPAAGNSPKAPLPTRAPGRWDEQEHDAFVASLDRFGPDWKESQKMIQSRTGRYRSLTQIRTHAQKFFRRLERRRNKAVAKGDMEAEAKYSKLLSHRRSRAPSPQTSGSKRDSTALAELAVVAGVSAHIDKRARTGNAFCVENTV